MCKTSVRQKEMYKTSVTKKKVCKTSAHEKEMYKTSATFDLG